MSTLKKQTGSIIIATDEFDPHADDVIKRLRAQGESPVRLHPSEILTRGSISILHDQAAFQARIQGPRDLINVDEIRSIWWRRPKRLRVKSGMSKQEAKFARSEYRQALNGLWATIDCYWMSRPNDIDLASFKLEQLRRAHRYGLDTPKTLITTKASEAESFVESCGGKAIYKTLSSSDLAAYLCAEEERETEEGSVGLLALDSLRTTKTTLITTETIKQHSDAIAGTVCLFQEYIPKQYELRVTIIGNKVFTAKIDSQANQATSIDWRNYDVPMNFSAGSIPEGLARNCLNLVKSYNLNFSTMDIIVTPDQRYVFLENNPNGQWMFVEKLIPEFNMTQTLCDCLCRITD